MCDFIVIWSGTAHHFTVTLPNQAYPFIVIFLNKMYHIVILSTTMHTNIVMLSIIMYVHTYSPMTVLSVTEAAYLCLSCRAQRSLIIYFVLRWLIGPNSVSGGAGNVSITIEQSCLWRTCVKTCQIHSFRGWLCQWLTRYRCFNPSWCSAGVSPLTSLRKWRNKRCVLTMGFDYFWQPQWCTGLETVPGPVVHGKGRPTCVVAMVMVHGKGRPTCVVAMVMVHGKGRPTCVVAMVMVHGKGRPTCVVAMVMVHGKGRPICAVAMVVVHGKGRPICVVAMGAVAVGSTIMQSSAVKPVIAIVSDSVRLCTGEVVNINISPRCCDHRSQKRVVSLMACENRLSVRSSTVVRRRQRWSVSVWLGHLSGDGLGRVGRAAPPLVMGLAAQIWRALSPQRGIEVLGFRGRRVVGAAVLTRRHAVVEVTLLDLQRGAVFRQTEGNPRCAAAAALVRGASTAVGGKVSVRGGCWITIPGVPPSPVVFAPITAAPSAVGARSQPNSIAARGSTGAGGTSERPRSFPCHTNTGHGSAAGPTPHGDVVRKGQSRLQADTLHRHTAARTVTGVWRVQRSCIDLRLALTRPWMAGGSARLRKLRLEEKMRRIFSSVTRTHDAEFRSFQWQARCLQHNASLSHWQPDHAIETTRRAHSLVKWFHWQVVVREHVQLSNGRISKSIRTFAFRLAVC